MNLYSKASYIYTKNGTTNSFAVENVCFDDVKIVDKSSHPGITDAKGVLSTPTYPVLSHPCDPVASKTTSVSPGSSNLNTAYSAAGSGDTL